MFAEGGRFALQKRPDCKSSRRRLKDLRDISGAYYSYTYDVGVLALYYEKFGGDQETYPRRVKDQKKKNVARARNKTKCKFQTVTRHRPRRRSQHTQWSRSFPPEVARESPQLEDEVFFEEPTPSTSAAQDVVVERSRTSDSEALEPLESPIRYSNVRAAATAPGWRRDRQTNVVRVVGEQTRPSIGGSRIVSSMLDSVLDNSNRRQYGMGWVGRMFG